MKHKIYLKSILSGLAMTVGFLLSSCADDLVSVGKSAYSLFDESDLIETQLGVSVNEFAVSTDGTTRADDPNEKPNEEPSGDTEIMSDFEKTVDNIWVFQYDTDGNLVIKPRYYTADKSETNGTWTVLLKPQKSTIYVVTNVNDDAWVSSENDITTKFLTTELLLASTLPQPYTIYNLSDEATEGHIPMKGCTEAVTPGSDGEIIVVPVEHMYAKVKVRVVIDKLLEPYEPTINSVYAQNCPWYCQIGTLYDETVKSQNDEYPTTVDEWVSRSMMTKDASGNEIGNNTNDPNNTPLEEADETPYEYVVYIPENIQGEVTTDDTDADAKADNLPEDGHPTSVVVSIKYTDSKEAEAEASYTVYPGGNNYNNFNIRRNQVYRVTMVLGAPETQHTPSANCIVGHPGKTISFEPYYRVETGGDYKFSDYLDPETNPIKGYQILWQTYECIGDNSDGSLVTFELDETDPIHSKFYVQVKEIGNAVIAAYDNENPDAEGANIIWSWHIWVTNEDPTNISNAVTYYTYAWDENGIYSYEYYTNLGLTPVRVPGYGMMSCNLGALASTPDNEYDQKIFGMNYQWGRKDPFPPLNIGDQAHNKTNGVQKYTVETVQQLYDNSHKATIMMTAEEGTDEMFRSVSGNTIIASPETYGVRYTIAHPTQYMCGSYDAGDLNFDDIYTDPKSYHNDGDWLPTGYSDNRLWGAEEITENTKTYTYNSSTHLYDNYGTKSIFDPCPYGWRVSPPDQWLGFAKDGINANRNIKDVNTVTDENYKNFGYGMTLYVQEWRSGLTSFFPTPGPRMSNGCGWRQYMCGCYTNATSDDNNSVDALHVHDAGNAFEILNSSYNYGRKALGGVIRCVRDTK